MYKVFFNDRIILLTDRIENCIHTDFNSIYKFAHFKELQDFTNRILFNDTLQTAIIYFHDLTILWSNFKECFKYIIAGGGLVENRLSHFLFIYRLEKWDLPKGKMEKNEVIQTTAVREVEEECGITGLEILSELPSTYHIYILNDQPILKRTYWFRMKYNGEENLQPQLEENITEVKWIKKGELDIVSKNTYPSINDVLANIL